MTKSKKVIVNPVKRMRISHIRNRDTEDDVVETSSFLIVPNWENCTDLETLKNCKYPPVIDVLIKSLEEYFYERITYSMVSAYNKKLSSLDGGSLESVTSSLLSILSGNPTEKSIKLDSSLIPRVESSFSETYFKKIVRSGNSIESTFFSTLRNMIVLQPKIFIVLNYIVSNNFDTIYKIISDFVQSQLGNESSGLSVNGDIDLSGDEYLMSWIMVNENSLTLDFLQKTYEVSKLDVSEIKKLYPDNEIKKEDLFRRSDIEGLIGDISGVLKYSSVLGAPHGVSDKILLDLHVNHARDMELSNLNTSITGFDAVSLILNIMNTGVGLFLVYNKFENS